MIDEIQALERATRNKEQRQFPPDVIDFVSIAIHKALQRKRQQKEEDERAAKRLCQESTPSHTTACHSNTSSSNQDDTTPTTEDASRGTIRPQLPPGYNIWWESTEAFKLFNASKEKETTVDRLQDLIAVLEKSNSTAVAYKKIVEGLDAENDDTMSEHKKEDVRMKARYLAQAYRIAIEEMPYC